MVLGEALGVVLWSWAGLWGCKKESRTTVIWLGGCHCTERLPDFSFMINFSLHFCCLYLLASQDMIMTLPDNRTMHNFTCYLLVCEQYKITETVVFNLQININSSILGVKEVFFSM